MERLSDYDYKLPELAIAQEPLADRSASRLLWLRKETGQVDHRQFPDVVDILQKGDLLVLNDTRVTAFRLFGEKQISANSPDTGAKVELLAIKQIDPQRYECLLKPGRRLQPGTAISFSNQLTAVVEANLVEGRKLVRFESSNDLPLAIKDSAIVPLPPYIHVALPDAERYQTVYARAPGSAAAPLLAFTSPLPS